MRRHKRGKVSTICMVALTWVACSSSDGGSGNTAGSNNATGGQSASGGQAGGSSANGSGGAPGSGGRGPNASGGAPGSGGNAGNTTLGKGGQPGTGGSAMPGGTGGAPDAGHDADSDAPSTDGRPDSTRDSAGSGGAGGIGTGGRTGSGGTAGPGLDGGTGLAAMTLWIAGDSTVKTYAAGNTDGNNGTELEGWGQEIGQFFSSKVTINNQAMGGRSVAMFLWATESTCKDSTGTPTFQLDGSGNKIDSSFWANIKKGIKPGDFLLAQFGHNDETNTCPRHVSATDFETYLGFMADTVIAKGATPIFVTPMGHRTFSGTKFNNTLLPYANAMKDEASKKKLEVEDLNLRSGEYYESVGNSYLASKIFDGGTTHFLKAGAVKMAELVVGEIKKNGGPLAVYLK